MSELELGVAESITGRLRVICSEVSASRVVESSAV